MARARETCPARSVADDELVEGDRLAAGRAHDLDRDRVGSQPVERLAEDLGPRAVGWRPGGIPHRGAIEMAKKLKKDGLEEDQVVELVIDSLFLREKESPEDL